MNGKQPIRVIGTAFAMLIGATWGHGGAAAQGLSCPFPDQKPMLVAQLFLGESIKDRSPITPTEWNLFLERVVTPRFPDGFTVYDARGQWLNTYTRPPSIAREKTKVIEIATEDTFQHREGLYEIRELYGEQFNQRSVGIVTNPGCGGFDKEKPPTQ